jgi:hypothetical protein
MSFTDNLNIMLINLNFLSSLKITLIIYSYEFIDLILTIFIIEMLLT